MARILVIVWKTFIKGKISICPPPPPPPVFVKMPPFLREKKPFFFKTIIQFFEFDQKIFSYLFFRTHFFVGVWIMVLWVIVRETTLFHEEKFVFFDFWVRVSHKFWKYNLGFRQRFWKKCWFSPPARSGGLDPLRTRWLMSFVPCEVADDRPPRRGGGKNPNYFQIFQRNPHFYLNVAGQVETREKPQGVGLFFRFLNEVSQKKKPTPHLYYSYIGNLNWKSQNLKRVGLFFPFSNEASTKKKTPPWGFSRVSTVPLNHKSKKWWCM